MTDLDIRRLDPRDEAAVKRVHAVMDLVDRHDTPENASVSEQRFARGLEHPPPGSESRFYYAEAGGEVVGYISAYMPTADNRQYLEAELAVHPDRRERGIGSALLDYLLAFANAEERTELIVTARIAWEGGAERSGTGARFLERRGLAAALTEVDRRLTVADLDAETEQRLWDEAAAASGDYDLVSWTGRAPEEYLEGLARIDSRIFEEIPLGDVVLQPRTLDVERIRARDDRSELIRATPVRTIAVHRETGHIAAHTAIYTFAGETDADQAITIVDPDHRGRRLGLGAKLANLRLLRQALPHVELVWAGNADSNAQMVSINDRLGYQVVDALICYKRKQEA
ncbi:GNAT family N-acetyltransferase [Glycomyces buryatensis]|uniref:GNAT family N-acetyltransferase n=1 Tax=Glycomyces buryatensis TaxID=2570927 RepID=A0A4S8Q2Z6_9ACTN|nr:GNAT family N-acetyltransferase [Glycomyces buryatensis]THV38567.1 GNAT family N-acetyltransferase [Glycomyces buryatensis]